MTFRNHLPGLAVAVIIAVLAWLMVEGMGLLPGVIGRLPMSMMLIAILIGLMLIPVSQKRPGWQPGLNLAKGPILKIAVALIGLRLSLGEMGALGLTALPLVVSIVIFGLLITLLLARLLGVERRLGVLLAAGTAICGASAIAATAPGLRARAEETGYAVACVALFGLAATIIYPLLLENLLDTPEAIGLVMGVAIHDTAQVTAAAAFHEQAFAADGTLNSATVAKLIRNSAMLIVVPLLVWWGTRNGAEGGGKAPFPWFIVAFIGFSVLRTSGDALLADDNAIWQQTISLASTISIFAFAMAMAALAMAIQPAQLRTLGFKPALAAALAALSLLAIALAWVRFMAP